MIEKGDVEAIQRHPNFRIFANMNPIDVGKKDLPPGLRNRFTEFYVDEIEDKEDLVILTGTYLDVINHFFLSLSFFYMKSLFLDAFQTARTCWECGAILSKNQT